MLCCWESGASSHSRWTKKTVRNPDNYNFGRSILVLVLTKRTCPSICKSKKIRNLCSRTDKQTFPYTTPLVWVKYRFLIRERKRFGSDGTFLQSCSLSIIGANLLQTCRGLSYRHLFPSKFIDWSMIKNVKKMFKTVFRSPFINFGTSCSRVRINHLHRWRDNQRRSCWKTSPVRIMCESENFNLESRRKRNNKDRPFLFLPCTRSVDYQSRRPFSSDASFKYQTDLLFFIIFLCSASCQDHSNTLGVIH